MAKGRKEGRRERKCNMFSLLGEEGKNKTVRKESGG
jgi:hypothetical protein